MRNIDTIPIIIKDHENVEYGIEESDLLGVVRNELSKYIPKLERFAKTHTEEECLNKTGTWWNEGRICDTTESTLDDYITNVLFKKA